MQRSFLKTFRAPVRAVRRAVQMRQNDRSHLPKVFGLGLSRTGTTSLAAALEQLGMKIAHFPLDDNTICELTNGRYRLTILCSHDGITDITTIPFYKELDLAYPGSKFILTVRDKDSWLASLNALLMREPPVSEFEKYANRPDAAKFKKFLREAVYGSNTFSRREMSAAYDRHTYDVMGYFKNRPEDLLTLDIIGGDSFSKLCRFLKYSESDACFPHLNVAPKHESYQP